MAEEAVVKPKKRGRPANVDAKEYIDNKKMTILMTEWVDEIVKRYELKGYEEIKKIGDRSKFPQMPNYLGECFIKIVDNYGNKANFRNYTYLKDMQSEALLTCVKYAHNFNPDKSKNAFAYFTQITHYCFLQIMAKEKHQTNIKMRQVNESSIYNYNNIHLESSEDAPA